MRGLRSLLRASFAAIVLSSAAPAAATTQTERLWIYAEGTALVSPHWALTVMPGYRYELGRSEGPTKDHYMNELFVGPTYVHRDGRFTAKLSLWYYYIGYPIRAKDDYVYSHNVELIPKLEWQLGAWTLSSRTIFHNTVYATVYARDDWKRGFGLVVREMLQAKWQAGAKLALIAAEEPFIGLIEDAQAPSSGAGYWQRGLRLNRLYAGFEWRPVPQLALTPMYVFETTHQDGKVSEIGHYGFLTASYVWKAFDASP
jgi:hypothetical protein